MDNSEFDLIDNVLIIACGISILIIAVSLIIFPVQIKKSWKRVLTTIVLALLAFYILSNIVIYLIGNM